MPVPEQKGFTLIEMMLAIVIFSLMSLMASQLLSSIVKNNALVQTQANALTRLQQAFSLMERDIRQTLLLPVEPSPRAGGNAPRLALLRSNWLNPGGLLARSSLERVTYRLHDGQLQRLSYPTPDAPESQARVITLIPGVESFHLRHRLAGRWQNGGVVGSGLPQAIEVTVTLSDRGTLQRIFLLAGGEAS
ncbi:PilD-dependent protein pddD [Serratia quinivorans]|uniref:type II secretion system minor pseudopilin GspJ n=1 Tax=Serratia quinivorans TaxID=137545 RepID=UPI00217A325B|nr:type II secretion system minor pseudopilin GspJ [Serratia quinivorans]CAI1749000.1 PilD-dependent protein pddD [Serratia quinivorans]